MIVRSTTTSCIFNGLNWEVIFEFSNYQQFNTQADDVKIKNPVKNP